MTNLHLVFSRPPADVTEDEWNAWYDAHLGEILSVPGFVSARRYRLDAVVDDIGFGYLTIYEVEGDPADAVAALERAGLDSQDSYVDKPDTLPVPGWFERIRFASVNATALDD